jgi:TRAP-type C4-dicarboxylate transport system substrate-binding protein
MKKLVIISSLIILVMGLFLGSCGEDETKPMTIKLGYDTPPTTNIGVPAEFFAEEVTKRTEGRITVETYPVGTLSTQASSLESLRAGVADAYLVSINSNLDAFPITSFTGLPGLDFFPYTKEKMKIEADTIREMMDKYPAVKKEFEGFIFLYTNCYSSAVIMGKGDPVRLPSAVKGQKVGADGYREDLVEYLQGAPVHTIPPMMYEQLQTGVLDLTTVAWGAAMDWQLQELVDYAIDISWGAGQLPVLMNESVWDQISSKDQDIIMEVAAEAEAVNREEVYKVIPQAQQIWRDAGVEIITPTDAEMAEWVAAFSVIWDEYLEMNKDAKDIDKILQAWKDAIEKTR